MLKVFDSPSSNEADAITVYDARQAAKECKEAGFSLGWWLPKANQTFLRVGPEPSEAHLLLLQDDITENITEDGLNHIISYSSRTSTGTSTSFKYAGWILQGAKAIIPSLTPQAGTLYLASFIDRRAYYNKVGVLNDAYNIVRDSDFRMKDPPNQSDIDLNKDPELRVYSQTGNPNNSGKPWTYAELIIELATKAGVAGDITNLGQLSEEYLQGPFSSLPGKTAEDPILPTNYRFFGCSAWGALCKVLDDIHHDICPLYAGDGSLQFIILPRTNTTIPVPSNNIILDNAHAINSFDSIVLPTNYKVFFPYKNFNYQSYAGQADVFDPVSMHETLKQYEVDVATSDVVPVQFQTQVKYLPGTTEGLQAEMVASRTFKGGIDQVDDEQRYTDHAEYIVRNHVTKKLQKTMNEVVVSGHQQFSPTPTVPTVVMSEALGGPITKFTNERPEVVDVNFDPMSGSTSLSVPSFYNLNPYKIFPDTSLKPRLHNPSQLSVRPRYRRMLARSTEAVKNQRMGTAKMFHYEYEDIEDPDSPPDRIIQVKKVILTSNPTVTFFNQTGIDLDNDAEMKIEWNDQLQMWLAVESSGEISVKINLGKMTQRALKHDSYGPDDCLLEFENDPLSSRFNMGFYNPLEFHRPVNPGPWCLRVVEDQDGNPIERPVFSAYLDADLEADKLVYVWKDETNPNAPTLGEYLEPSDYLRALEDYDEAQNQGMYHLASDPEILWGGGECP